MASSSPIYLPAKVQQAFLDYHRLSSISQERQWNLREQMRLIDLDYIRENDWTKENRRAVISNRYGDSDKLQNITLPVIKPQVVQAVAYQAGVFLSDIPIFGVISDPQWQDAALQLQAVIEENSIRGAWARELMLFFFDGFKYNISAVECDWKRVALAALDTDSTYKKGQEGKPKEVIWSGNCIKRWDPYNTYWDTRVDAADIPTRGDFAGHTELFTRVGLKAFIHSLPSKIWENITPAFKSPCLLGSSSQGAYGASYFLPQINPNAILDSSKTDQFDWNSWAGLTGAQLKDGVPFSGTGLYEVSTEYIRIIPSDFGLNVPDRNTPQVWKQIIVNHSVVIYAERQTNAHEKIPVFFGSPKEDGLGYQTKSLATDATPFQQVGSALMNSVIAARRRAINDRTLYDPSRVSEVHMNSSNPAAKIPVRPSAYGKPVAEAVHQFPYKDDQSAIAMQEIMAIVQFGNVLNGQNAARQGQFVKGNKTDGQWESTMSNATSSDQLTALLYEAQVFTPLKEVLKLNTLQYQTGTSYYSPSQEREVKIDPIVLRQATLNFKVTDGIATKEKQMSTDSLKIAMQVIGSSEVLASGYNIAPMFSYIMKTENVNLKPFEKTPEQLAYEQALGIWQQLASLAIEKQQPFNQPQPKPQDYGYDPKLNNPAARVTNQPTSTQTLPSGGM